LDRIKGIGLVSGGLDSSLAVRIIKDQGIEVEAVHFTTRFHSFRVRPADQEGAGAKVPFKPLIDMGLEVRRIDISEEYLQVITSPKFGYGSGANPCIDCKIFMLRKAKEYMEDIGAHFVFTGEVLGQRPMSQRIDTLRIIERESGLEGYLLRPLSAKLLPPTIPEIKGWVDRERLLGISGRSRKEQMRLAEELGIEEYLSPAGGCFLTDKAFSNKLNDFFKYSGREKLTVDEVMLLKLGRHFRISDRTKAIVGRHMAENASLEESREGRWYLKVVGFPGPVTLVEGDPSEEELKVAASIAARYSDGRDAPQVEVVCERNGERVNITVNPISDSELEDMRI